MRCQLNQAMIINNEQLFIVKLHVPNFCNHNRPNILSTKSLTLELNIFIFRKIEESEWDIGLMVKGLF
jgi:hypothetical protein